MQLSMDYEINPAVDKNDLEDICELASHHNTTQVWLFGSASHSGNYMPADFDIAIFSLSQTDLKGLAGTLQRNYPSSRIQWANNYRKALISPDKDKNPFHFLLATEEEGNQFSPIICSIKRGMCLWKKESY